MSPKADGQAPRLFGDGWPRQRVLFLLHLAPGELSSGLLPAPPAAPLPGGAGARESRGRLPFVHVEPSLAHPRSGICSLCHSHCLRAARSLHSQTLPRLERADEPVSVCVAWVPSESHVTVVTYRDEVSLCPAHSMAHISGLTQLPSISLLIFGTRNSCF